MPEKRTRYSPRKITRLVLIVALITGAVVYCCRREGALPFAGLGEERHYTRLSDTLTNEMSTYPGTEEMDREIERYLRRWEIIGAQIAVSRGDTLVYAKGFGYADREKDERMTPRHIMRICSVSKLLTAAAVMKLKEQGRLTLSDHVFGPEGILSDSVYTAAIRDRRHLDITVEQLLRHEAGFNNRHGDPMFSTRYIMMQHHLSTPPTNPQLLQIVLGRQLGYTPGTGRHYSNLGYTLLSLIIERVSGQTYADYMQEHILRPAGCYHMTLAGNYPADRQEKEVKYYMHRGAEPTYEFNNSGKLVPKCYGENNIPLLLGAGAWCASAAELCRFVAAIDSLPEQPDILSKESIGEMTREMPDGAYSLGWNKTPQGKPWTRTGTLSGSTALVARYPDGQCWVFVANTSTWKGQKFAHDTLALFQKLRERYSHALHEIIPLLQTASAQQ